MTLSKRAPFKGSGFSLALGKLSKGATYYPAALQHIAARVAVTLLGLRTDAIYFLPSQTNNIERFFGIC
jgi:hypothetical protein